MTSRVFQEIVFFLIFFLCSLLQAEPVVSAVRSKIFSTKDLNIIQTELGLQAGQLLKRDHVDRGIRALFETGGYQTLSIQMEKDAKGFVIWVSGSRLKKIRKFEHASVDEQVWEQLKLKSHLKEGEGTDISELSLLKEKVRSAYEEQGYYSSEIQVLLKDIPETDDVDVSVEVTSHQPTVVSGIRLLGAPDDELDEMLRVLPIRQGSILTRAELEESTEKLNEYFRSHQYATSKVEESALEFSSDKSTVGVTFTLKLGDRFEFEFTGNQVFDEVELRNLLTPEVLSQNDAQLKIAALVKEKYQQIGYHYCDVKVQVITLARRNLRRVRFTIDEGSKVLIDHVEFSSGTSQLGIAGVELSQGELANIFYDHAAGVIRRRVYWEAGIGDSAAAMKIALEKQGYLRVSVNPSPRTIFTEDRKGVQLFFDIELGNQTILNEISIEGVSKVPIDELKAAVPIAIGDPVDVERLEQGKKNIIDRLYRAGYLDAAFEKQTDGELRVSTDQRRADFVLKVHEGKVYFVGEIEVSGNAKTQTPVILREMKVERGGVYNPEEIRRSEEDIALLGLFSRVEIVAVPSPKDPQVKDLRVVVTETIPGFGELGIGGAYEEPRFRARSFFSIAYRNLMGLNQTVSARTELTLPFSARDRFIPFLEYSAILGYRAPYPFDLPFNFVAQAGLDSFETATNSDGTHSRVQTRARIEERVERKLSRVLTAYWRLHRYEHTTTESVPEDPSDPTQRDIIGSTGPGLIVDVRDDAFNPTKGSYHALDLEYAHPVLLSHVDIHFYMLQFRNSFYLPLVFPFSFAAYFGVGYAESLHEVAGLPSARLENELALGGQGSIRGFSLKKFRSPDGVPRTGFYNGRAELSCYVLSDVSVAAFFDMGQLYAALAPSERHDGIGIGVRYKTPVGPVAIDFAQGLGEDKENVKFYFRIGNF